MLNERARPFPIREWGHPSGIYTSQLVRVPWLVCDHDGERKDIVHEALAETESTVDHELHEKRLSVL